MLLKNLLFTCLVVTAFFAAGELVLGLAGVQPSRTIEDPFFGFARNIPLFVAERQDDGSSVLRTADNKLDLFNPQTFAATKGPNSYRIFCMGGSTTYGRPYTDRVSFCGWLRAYLQAADPARDWEVINAGGVSYASYRVVRLMTELTQYQPDMFIVYTGQNEFLEQRSYGGLIDVPGWLIDLNATLSRTRFYTAMSKLIDTIKPGTFRLERERNVLNGEVDEILNHTIGPQSYRRDDNLRQQVMTHFRLNLERMVDIARDAGAGLILVQPAINLRDMSPFKSEHREGLEDAARANWQALVDRAAELEDTGNTGAALAIYRTALAIDDRHAELHYRLGKALFAQGHPDEAGQAFRRAVEEDVAPLRILEPMQRIIAETAAAGGVPLVDFTGILRAVHMDRYGHAVFGKEFFVDHVHTNKEGYRLLGQALFERLTGLGIATPADAWSQTRLDAVTREVIAGLDPAEEGHALMKLGKVMEWAGKFSEAYSLYQQALDILGPGPRRYDRLARTAYVLGQLEDAVRYLEEILLLAPAARGVHAKLAVLLAEQGRTAQAIAHCEAELLLAPGDYHVRARLAELLEQRGDDAAALQEYRRVLDSRPDLARAHLRLAYLLLRQDRFMESLEHGRQALHIDPTLYRSHNVIGLALQQQEKLQEAAHHFAEALRLAPGYAAARDNLARLQARRRAQENVLASGKRDN